MPSIIEGIKKYNMNKFPGWKPVYLNDKNLDDYIPKWAFPENYSNLIQAHKADWIRLYLLYRYGGCWLDCSIIINKSEALDDIYNKSQNVKADLTVFQSDLKNRTFTHISGRSVPLVIDNWLIFAPKNSIIIKLWLDEYTKAINMGFLEYKKNVVIKSGTDISKIYTTGDNDVYLTQHMCIEYILQKKIKNLPNIIFLNSFDSMFKLSILCDGKPSSCLEDKFNNDNATVKEIPYIKLTRHDRNIDITKFLNTGQ
jgi:hypothetical protein